MCWKVSKDDDGVVSGKLTLNSVYLPHIDSSQFASKLTGKSQNKVADIVGGDGVSNTDVVFNRSLPFMPKILPFNKSNVIVVTKKE